MSKKNKPDKRGFVYSTDPAFSFEPDEAAEHTLPPGEQILRVWLDTRLRAGKAATLVKGFVGKTEDLEALGRQLKNHCGTGGSAKDGDILVQGDHREKVLKWLIDQGYRQTKKAG